jgi:hypothetical protein
MCDYNGNIIWDKIPRDDWNNNINSAIQTCDSCYLVTGFSRGRLYIAKVDQYLTGLRQLEDVISQTLSLSQNYPNPFNPSTTIEFDLPKTSEVSLKVFNILGEEVTTLVSDMLSVGSYSYEWDASSLASGVYLYRLEAEGFVETRKMILMK